MKYWLYFFIVNCFFSFLAFLVLISAFSILTAVSNREEDAKKSPPPLKKSDRADNEVKKTKGRIMIREKRRSKGVEGTFSEIELHKGENKTKGELTNVLEGQLGIHINRLGGSGTYSSLSLRGVPSQETAVYFDGILLNDPLGGAVNLGGMPLELFKSIEFYSEHTPIHLPGSSLGGTIDLIPKEISQEDISFFGKVYADTLLGGKAGLGIAWMRDFHYLSFEASQNRYSYLDDGGTPLINRTDDQIRDRKNEDFWAIGYTSFIQFYENNGSNSRYPRLKILLNYYGKRRGHAGNIRAPLEKVRLDDHRAILKLAYPLTSLSWFSITPYLSAHGTYSSLEDPLKELGFRLFNQKRVYYSMEAGIRPSFYFLDDSLNLYLFLGGRFYQVYSDTIIRYLDHLANRYEINTGMALEYYVKKFPLKIVNSFKGIWLKDSPYSSLDRIPSGSRNTLSQGHFLPSYSILIQIRLIELYDKILQNHFSKEKRKVILYFQSTPIGERAPYIYEAYGDGALVLPNHGLRKEHSKMFSTGVQTHFNIVHIDLFFKASYFRNQFDHLILLLMNSEKTFRAENIGASLNQGVELELKVIWQDHFLLLNRFNYLKAVDQGKVSFYLGKDLPFLPQYKTFHYLEGGLSWFKLFVEVLWRGKIYRDRFNTQESFLPWYLQINVGLIYFFLKKQYSLFFTVQNVLDQRNHYDVTGYPLPGVIFKLQINKRLI